LEQSGQLDHTKTTFEFFDFKFRLDKKSSQ
jgi:hypothetical protein